MKQAIAGLLALTAIAALIVVLAGEIGLAERVYSVDEVLAGLRYAPRAWYGRTVLVRGWTGGVAGVNCQSVPSPRACPAAWLILRSDPPGGGGASAAIFVRLPPAGSDPTRADPLHGAALRLGALPLVGPLLARWASSRTLRVTLTRSAGAFCNSPPVCAQGVLAP